MSLAGFPELKRLTSSEKLQLADALWQAGISDSTPVSAEQKTLLDDRWTAYKAGKIKRITIEEMERRLDKR